VGFRPTKGLGQNFLVDPNAARSIALDSGVGAGDRVLEIGAGCGFLTVHLAELGVELLAVEIDTRLIEVAARFLSGYSLVRLLRRDVLSGKHGLDPEVLAALPAEGPWDVVSNLPYSISGPALALLGRLVNPPRSMTVLVQEEVAERVAAAPGSSAWGALPARLGALYRARLGRRIGEQLFWPRPRVASRVVQLHLQPLEGLRPSEELPAYDSLVDLLFTQRRKQLLGVLASALGDRDRAARMVSEAGLDPRIRPEELHPEVLLRLSRSPGWGGSLSARA